jgi:hypothetical protein
MRFRCAIGLKKSCLIHTNRFFVVDGHNPKYTKIIDMINQLWIINSCFKILLLLSYNSTKT